MHQPKPVIEEVVVGGVSYPVLRGFEGWPDWLVRLSEFWLIISLIWLIVHLFRFYFDPVISYAYFMVRLYVNSSPVLVPLPGSSSISTREFRQMLGIFNPSRIISDYMRKLQIDLQRYATAIEDLTKILGEVKGVKVSLVELARRSASLFMEEVYGRVRFRTKIVMIMIIAVTFLVGLGVGYALGLILQPVSPEEVMRIVSNVTGNITNVTGG